MRKNLLVLLSFLVFGAYPTLVFAQDDVTATTNTAAAVETGDTVTTAPTGTTTADTKIPLRKQLTTARQEIKTTAMEAKETMHQEISQARTNFKTKLTEIKDTKKQEIVTNLDNRIATINKNRTDEMSKRLDRLTTILGKISTKEATLKSEGKNTVTLASDIAAALTSIDAAKQAVTDQSAKDYVMTITTDTALRSSASTTIKQFMTDIKAVFLKVTSTQKAVVKAYQDLGALQGTTPTPSADVAPTTP